MTDTKQTPSGIVLFAKQSGRTSFSSLFTIKHALNTKKVGHTGTLDCFADGLLVVLTGPLTHLVPYITCFNKSYEAVIKFGEETDTLDPNGTVIKKAYLPTIDKLEQAVKQWTGKIDQAPPSYSALHIDGVRASDIARKGGVVEMASRPVTVFSSEIVETKLTNGLVEYAHIRCHVSKGTYIRSLARDIALSCGTVGHLIALRRTSVGSFKLSDAAGSSYLKTFTLDNALIQYSNRLSTFEQQKSDDTESFIQKEVLQKIQSMTPQIAVECGIKHIQLKHENEQVFTNGQPLRKSLFVESFTSDGEYAVFMSNGRFAGIVKNDNDFLKYGFVVPRIL